MIGGEAWTRRGADSTFLLRQGLQLDCKKQFPWVMRSSYVGGIEGTSGEKFKEGLGGGGGGLFAKCRY